MSRHVHTHHVAAFTGGQRAAAQTFKSARLRKAFSQRRLARAAGVAVGVIQNFEAMIDDRDNATWPDDIRRAKLELAVNLPAGELERIAAGGSLTQAEAEAHLRLLMIEHEAIRRRVILLRAAATERREEDVQRLADEIDEILGDSEAD